MMLTLIEPTLSGAHEAVYAVVASTLTFATVASQGVLRLVSNRRRRKEPGEPTGATLARIETKVDDLATEQRRAMQEQLQINHDFDMRIRGAYAHLIGEDGKNGQRSEIRKLERRVEVVEERERESRMTNAVNTMNTMLHGSYDRRTSEG